MHPDVLKSRSTMTVVVTPEMTATLDDLVAHPIYSTFWIAYHAELCARMAIASHFEPNEDAVGTGLELQHVAMAAVGATVTISATVMEVVGSRIRCAIEVQHAASGRVLAHGTQDQYVLSRDRLAALVAQACS